MAVYAKQYGRTGNQLFQKAAAIGYAMKNGIGYSTGPYRFQPDVLLTEHGHQYQELPYLPEWKGSLIFLDGYWQSERYFAHCREEVIKAFGFPWEPKKGWCSIHVRRGDYLKYPDKHPVVTMEYIAKAIEYLQKNQYVYGFMVFSDDIQWCKTWMRVEFGYSGLIIKYINPSENPITDLVKMSECEHNIISNSTYSWWAAWLNQNPNKVVISPSKDNWFGPGNVNLCTDDIIPESWIQIKY